MPADCPHPVGSSFALTDKEFLSLVRQQHLQELEKDPVVRELFLRYQFLVEQGRTR